MKKFSKLISLSIVSAIAASMLLTGCGAKPAASTPASTPASAPAASTPASTPATAGLKIAICTSPNAVDDGSFNENVYDGIQKFVKANPGSTVTNIQETTGAPDAAIAKMGEIVGDYDVIVGSGFQFGGLNDIAKQNPDKKFIVVDAWPAKDEVLPNVYAMQFAEQESGFFAGMAAALETKTNKVAVVNGQAFPSNVNYQYGFQAGVQFVNETEGKKVELIETGSHAGTDVTGANVGGNYTGNFGDIEAGKKLGEALIAKGCDVIFVAAGDSGNGVFAAAKEAKTDVKIIGCDVDQYDDGANGDKNIILTSGLKVMDVVVERSLNTIADGSFKGGNVVLTLKDDATGYVKADGRNQLSKETITKIDAAQAKVKDGSIVPPSNFGVQPKDFKVAK
ncbi:MAG: BMP family ABC transporter substrate-binding protein [Oscillospiraceae bacterium]|nr:BMP family ABC transporter substrate-binding protein [Oscillospiraceae bacterium]